MFETLCWTFRISEKTNAGTVRETATTGTAMHRGGQGRRGTVLELQSGEQEGLWHTDRQTPSP
jgi:hypothetical protein